MEKVSHVKVPEGGEEEELLLLLLDAVVSDVLDKEVELPDTV